MTSNNSLLPQVLQNPASSGTKALPYSRKAATRRWIVWGVVAVLAVFGLGFPVETVVQAQGKVIPSDQVKAIQHLEGGIVSKVLVKEGDRVTANQPLVEIDLGGNSLNLEELTARYASLSAARTRLLAESQGKPIKRSDFGKEVEEPVYLAEAGAYEARALEQKGIIDAAQSQLAQTRSKVVEQQERINAMAARLALYKKEVDVSQQLVDEKLIPQLEFLEKQRQLETTKGEVATAKQALVSAQAAVIEAQGKVLEAEGRFRRRASDELSTAERSLASVSEDLSRARVQRSRTTVRAPADGIVKGLRNTSPGWVVKPGEPFMEVVPDREEITVEARLSPADRGYVHVNQSAQLKVSAYDYLRYGSVQGKVKLVGADADTDPMNPAQRSYYRVLVSAEKDYVGVPEHVITAGMEVQVDLLVGRDPFIWYILRPVLKVQREAFQEP